jgi:F-type H+-transporting ATPase subunit delta
MAEFTTVARPYARALFSIASAAGSLQGWSDALNAAARIVEDESARRFLGRPDLRPGDRARFVAGVCARLDDAGMLQTPEGQGLLQLLDENERLGALPAIAAQFDRLKVQAENKIGVTLVAAVKVDGEIAESVARSLERKLGRKVELALEVDETLIGGAVIRAEDMVIDGSVRRRLQRLADALID